MAGERPAAYDEQTARRVLERLNALERKQNALLSGGYNQTFPRGPLVARWGRTTTNADYPTYPTDGNVVACELGDVDPSPLYPGLTAAKTFTAYDPQEVVVATLENGAIPSEGTIVRLTWRNGKWWIGASHLRKAKANASISAGGSGSIKLHNADGASETVTGYYTWADTGAPALSTNDEIWVVWLADEEKWYILPFGGGGTSTSVPTCVMFNGNGYNGDSSNKNRLVYQSFGHANNRIVYEHFINGWGDFSGVGCTPMTTASAVGAGTKTYTDPCFKLTQAGLYRFVVQFGSEDTTTDNAYTTDTVTTSNASAGTAHTHTVDVRREHGRRSQIRVMLQWRNSGDTSWSTTDYQMAAWTPQMEDDSISGTLHEVDEEMQTFVFWQNHNSPNREYRIQLSLLADFDSQLTNVQRDVYADSGLIAITRLADYTADATLTI